MIVELGFIAMKFYFILSKATQLELYDQKQNLTGETFGEYQSLPLETSL